MKTSKTSHNGLEVINLLDEDNNVGMSITMESIFEARELEELDATKLIDTATLVAPEPKTRLVHNNLVLTHKTTGKTLTGPGTILPLEERLKKNITATWLSLQTEEGTYEQIVIPYKKDGSIPEAFPYDIREEKKDE